MNMQTLADYALNYAIVIMHNCVFLEGLKLVP